MNRGMILKGSFVAGIVLIIVGAFSRSTNHNLGVNLLILGFVLSFVFVVGALYEVRTSTRIQASEKTEWTIGLLTMWFLVGWKYLLFGRRRIVS